VAFYTQQLDFISRLPQWGDQVAFSLSALIGASQSQVGLYSHQKSCWNGFHLSIFPSGLWFRRLLC